MAGNQVTKSLLLLLLLHLRDDDGGGLEVDLVVLDAHGEDPPERRAQLLQHVRLQLPLAAAALSVGSGGTAPLAQTLHDRRATVVLWVRVANIFLQSAAFPGGILMGFRQATIPPPKVASFVTEDRLNRTCTILSSAASSCFSSSPLTESRSCATTWLSAWRSHSILRSTISLTAQRYEKTD